MISRQLHRLAQNESIDPELQQHLTAAGYYGRTAKCHRCTLIGVERPGWVQVFEIHLSAKRQSGDWEEMFAICRTDERDGTYAIELFDSQPSCRAAHEQNTSGMIVTGRGVAHPLKTTLMILFIAALAIAVIGALLTLAGVADGAARS